MSGLVKHDGSFVNELALCLDGRAGYRAALHGIAPLSTITDFFAIINNSGKALVMPKKISVSGYIATAAVALDLLLVKRHALSTGQSVVPVTAEPMDLEDPVANAVVQDWSGGAPSQLAAGTVIGSKKLFLPVGPASPTLPPGAVEWDFTLMKPPILRSLNEYLALSFNGQSWANAMSLDIEIEWEEA